MLTTYPNAFDFVPAQLDATRWVELEPLYRALIARPLNTPADLEKLLLDRSELDAAASEAGSLLHIAMTRHTDDEGTKQAYLDFVEHVLPPLKEATFALDRKIVSSPLAAKLDAARYRVLLRDLRAAVDLFRPANIPIETELTKLEQEYSEICGAMTVNFDGVERTLPAMAKFQEERDRTVRERAWRAVAERRLRDRAAIEANYERMLPLRQQQAHNADCRDYREFAFKAKRRFDYTPSDCDAFARGVERHIVPAVKAIHRARAKNLGISTVRPWDLAVDERGRPALKPFTTADELTGRSSRAFHRMDASLGTMFDTLRGGDFLDLDARKGKAPGGYQANRDRRRVPFIFMNAVGVQRDVETMVHEAGHAFHALLSRDENLLAYRSEIPLEFCEVASMSMELTAGPFLDEFYTDPGDAVRARRAHLEELAARLAWIATIDQFQQWVFTNPGHSAAERHAKWLSLLDRFGGDIDWAGLDEERANLWHRQLHLFLHPFYYIEYGIAQLGALQLYARYRTEPKAAIADYKRALALGGSRPLPELFAAAGLKFDFAENEIGRAWSAVSAELQTT
ncbi:M3 family oligoendopeptidase [soil metagenome]